MIGGRNRLWDSTYIAGSDGGDDKRTGIETAILRTCKKLHREASPTLYGQTIFFTGSAQGAVSWLHDVSNYLGYVTSLVYTYRNVGSKQHLGPRLGKVQFQPTSDPAFRRLCNALVHKCEALSYLGLVIDDKFWTKSSWREGAALTFTNAEYLNCKSAQFQESNNGVHVQLRIDRTFDDEKVRFVRELERCMKTKRAERPTLAAKRRCNGCGEGRYKDCCFVKLPINEQTSRGKRWKLFHVIATLAASGNLRCERWRGIFALELDAVEGHNVTATHRMSSS